jgi:hypothetical protein
MNTLDLYLDTPPGTVVKTSEISDVACGMYPCYYRQADSEVWVSTSAATLAGELGTLHRDRAFTIPDYIHKLADAQRCSTDSVLSSDLFNSARSIIRSHLPDDAVETLTRLNILSSDAAPWYEPWNTIDNRIRRLRPFETVTPASSDRAFDLTYSLCDRDELAHRTAEHLTRFINRIEEEYPDYEHVVLTGGKDSQLISLVPKRTDNWHLFSADPNYPLVKRFVKRNDIDINTVFRSDNTNKERLADLRRKLVCSDLMSDPTHIRWQVELQRVVEELGGDCILWLGTEAEAFNTYHPDFHEADDYFQKHFTRPASWQANFHQTTANFAGVPVLSPYHSEAIWKELYRHYDPNLATADMDIRPQIGAILHDDDVWWPDSNPGPDTYTYDLDVDASELFLSGLYDEAGIEEIRYPAH